MNATAGMQWRRLFRETPGPRTPSSDSPQPVRIAVLLTLFATLNLSLAEETAFRGVKLADANGKQADASLLFSDNNKNVAVRVADRDFVTIPYDQIDKFSYEYTKKHRITQGAVVMVASLGAGVIVMLTKSKSHWLYVNYHEQNVSKSVVLRMDKNEYRKIFDAIKTHTGQGSGISWGREGQVVERHSQPLPPPSLKPASQSSVSKKSDQRPGLVG